MSTQTRSPTHPTLNSLSSPGRRFSHVFKHERQSPFRLAGISPACSPHSGPGQRMQTVLENCSQSTQTSLNTCCLSGTPIAYHMRRFVDCIGSVRNASQTRSPGTKTCSYSELLRHAPTPFMNSQSATCQLRRGSHAHRQSKGAEYDEAICLRAARVL